MQSNPNPSLYGITPINSSRHGPSLWGKNQFNSTFPLALCLYMRDQGLSPVAVIERDGQIVTDDTQWPMADVIGSASAKTRYLFESAFEPYAQYCRDDVDKIDLVVTADNKPLRPLEVKLTVVPDSATARLADTEWAPELVMRPVSSAYSMMSVAANLRQAENLKALAEVLARLRLGYNQIKGWENEAEISQHHDILSEALSGALNVVAEQGLQRPFLIQPLWRTKGQSFELDQHCFDVFVWSDVAIMRVPVDQSEDSAGTASRPHREIARHVRGLYELLSQGDYSYSSIYKGMPLGFQTDKSFSLSGRKSISYLGHRRLFSPILQRSVLGEIVSGGGEGELKPERRFDAAVLHYMISQS